MTTNLHPLAVLALAGSTPRPDPIDNSELVERFRAEGGQIVHIIPKKLLGGQYTRGITVAFKRKSGHIEMATAVQHRNDTFTKKMGTKTAIEHFDAGRTVSLPAGPVSRHYSTAKAIKDYIVFIR
jgi:hypothetical protein